MASGSVRAMVAAAQPMHGAVLRATGSAITCDAGTPGRAARVASTRLVPVEIQTRSSGDERLDAPHGRGDERLVRTAGERQELLRGVPARCRPETRARAAGEDHGVDVRTWADSYHGPSRGTMSTAWPPTSRSN